MWSRKILVLPFAIAASAIHARSAEQPPFHVSQFDDNVTVNLTVDRVPGSGVA